MSNYAIRAIVVSDAQRLVSYLQELAREPGIPLPFGPEGFTLTVEEEEAFIEDFNRNDRNLFLLAEADEEIISVLSCRHTAGTLTEHETVLGISVHREWRNRGVGRAMMKRAIDWASNHAGIRRIQLEVFAHNANAIHLYETLGFEHEGRRRKAYFKDGEYIDTLMMAMLFDKD